MTKVRILPPMYDAIEITDVDRIPVPIVPPLGGDPNDPPLTANGEPVEVGDFAVHQDAHGERWIILPKEFVQVVPDDMEYPRDGSDVYSAELVEASQEVAR